MTSDAATREIVLGMWKALSDRDWESVKSFLSDDCLYVDMPMPAVSARGPENIVARLKIGLESLSSYVNHEGLLLSDGVDVMYEHSETWGWPTGETVRLAFVSVHRVRGRQDHPLEGLLGLQHVAVPGATIVHRRLRVRRHVVGVRRD